jgi:Rieske Fe-S protein
MSEQNSRRQFMISSTGLIVAAGCGAEETGGPGQTNEPIGDPDYYPNTMRSPQGPMDNDMPVCSATAGLTAGPMAGSLSVNQLLQVSGNLYIGRDSKGLFAINITCTHAGCTTSYQPNSQNWVCGCHGSTFGMDGSLIKGPAARPFPRYYVCKGSDGRLYIDMTKMI